MRPAVRATRRGLQLGIDGCGIPVFATPLRNAALAFSRLATLEGIDERDARALRVVRDAMVAFPQYVAGTGEFDTALMRAAGGRIAAKSGAEGVHGLADIATGTGLVLKVVDGRRSGVRAGCARGDPPVAAAGRGRARRFGIVRAAGRV